MDLGVIAMKKYFPFPKPQGLDPHDRIQFSVRLSIFVGRANPLRR